MAQGSVWWDGTTVGDASGDIWDAPLSSAEFSDVFAKLLASDTATRGYIAPGYGNQLRVQANSPSAMNVVLKSGSVFIRGRYYENNADQTLSIGTADATNPRIDRIILRVSLSASVQTITAVVLAGTPAATPSMPSLTNSATILEIPLAWVWVAAASANVPDTEVHDERVFAANFESFYSMFSNTNLIKNSEFMAHSGLETGASATEPPDYWTEVNTATFASATKPTQMSRGRAISLVAGAASAGMSQTFRVIGSTAYVIRVLMNVTAGDVGEVVVTTNSASPGTITRYIRRTGSYIEETIYYTTESDATTLTVRLLGLSNTDIVQYGQALAARGYHTGPFREFSELLRFERPLRDTSWDGDAKSSSTVTIDLTASYKAGVLAGTQAVILRIIGRDSGSLAGSDFVPALQVSRNQPTDSSPFLGVYLQGEANDRSKMTVVMTRVLDTPSFVIHVDASGVGTLDATVDIIGIQT